MHEDGDPHRGAAASDERIRAARERELVAAERAHIAGEREDLAAERARIALRRAHPADAPEGRPERRDELEVERLERAAAAAEGDEPG